MENNQQAKMERAILAWLLCDGNIKLLNPELSITTFADNENKKIFKRMVELLADGQSINAFNLSDVVDCVDLAKYENEVFLFGTPMQLSDMLVELEKKRMIRKKIEQLLKQCDTATESVPAILFGISILNKQLKEFRQSGNISVQHIQEVLTNYLNEINLKNETLRTGIPLFDTFVEINRCEYDVWGGRPSEGKSALSLRAAIGMARNGFKGLYISSEMSTRQQCERMFPGMTNIRSEYFKNRQLNGLQLQCCLDVATNCTLPLWFKFSSTKINQIENILEDGEYDFCFVDYLQFIQADEPAKREEEISGISKRFKRAAQDHNIALIALSQINRAGGTESEPEISHLRESGAIEQDADRVLLIFKDKQHRMIIKIGKNRQGKKGKFSMIPVWDYWDFRGGEWIE